MNGGSRRALWGVALALAVGGCGRGTRDGGGAAQSAGPGGGAAGADGPCREVTIWIAGVRQGPVSALGLAVADVALTRGGAPVALASCAAGTTVDLSADGVARTLGTFTLPEGDAPLSLSISLSGGSSVRDGVAHDLDRCAAPLTVTVPPDRIGRATCQIRVLLDVGRSIVADGDGLAFVPQLRTFFF